MHELLKSRGYRFTADSQTPTIRAAIENMLSTAEDEDAINTILAQNKDELTARERRIQECKLDFYLARARPADLKAANELMKVISGYVRDFSLETFSEKAVKLIFFLFRKTTDLMIGSIPNWKQICHYSRIKSPYSLQCSITIPA